MNVCGCVGLVCVLLVAGCWPDAGENDTVIKGQHDRVRGPLGVFTIVAT
jgi:hypothetical protein